MNFDKQHLPVKFKFLNSSLGSQYGPTTGSCYIHGSQYGPTTGSMLHRWKSIRTYHRVNVTSMEVNTDLPQGQCYIHGSQYGPTTGSMLHPWKSIRTYHRVNVTSMEVNTDLPHVGLKIDHKTVFVFFVYLTMCR